MREEKEKKAKEEANNKVSITSMLSSKSVMTSSTAVSKQMVASLAQQLLGYEIDRQDVDSTMTSLREYDDCNIHAVWLCSRPILRIANGRFQHWCIKIHGGSTLLEMDFFEKDGKGAFGLKAKTTMVSELDEFLKYFIQNDKKEWEEKQYTILACVLPTLPLSEEEQEEQEEEQKKTMLLPETQMNKMYKMPELISQCLDEYEEQGQLDGFIPCKFSNRQVSEVINFLEEWTIKYKEYNALSCNCQTFAKDLYEFIIGKDYHYQLEEIIHKMQSFMDFDREWKKFEDDMKKMENENDSNIQSIIKTPDNVEIQ